MHFLQQRKNTVLKFAFILLNLSYKLKLNKLILSFFHHYAIIMFFLLFICLSICLSVHLSICLSISFSLSPFLKFAFFELNLKLNKTNLWVLHYYGIKMFLSFYLFICLSCRQKWWRSLKAWTCTVRPQGCRSSAQVVTCACVLVRPCVRVCVQCPWHQNVGSGREDVGGRDGGCRRRRWWQGMDRSFNIGLHLVRTA